MTDPNVDERVAASRFEDAPGALEALRRDFEAALRQDPTLADQYPAIAALVAARGAS